MCGVSKARNPNIVKAFTKFEYSPDQQAELEKCEADPIYFIKTYVKIQHPTRGCVPFDLYPYQEDLIEAIHNNRQLIVTISRQAGKTTCLAAYALWFACFNEDKTVLIVSNKNSNAMEFVHRCKYAYEELPNWLKPGVNPELWTKHDIGFDNKSRILSQATTESSGRGLSIGLLIADELAHVNPRVVEAFWTSVSPTLSTGGKCAISSTPNGDTDLFSLLFRGAEAQTNGFTSRFYDCTHVPHITQEFLDQETAKIGELKVRQEYYCEFLSSEELLFSSIMMAGMTTAMQKNQHWPSTRNNMVFYEEILPAEATYVVGVDPGKGVGNDFSAIQVWRVAEKVTQVAEYRSNEIKTPQLYQMLKRLLIKLDSNMKNLVFFGIENNGVGEGLIALYQNDPGIMALGGAQIVNDPNQIGMVTTGYSKLRACLLLKDMIESGKLNINSHDYLREMKTYARYKSSYAAMYGSTDDLISASLICTRILKEQVASYNIDAFNALYEYSEDFNEHDLTFLPSLL
jgi:Terminase RNaseH-like domain/Terminase large subunit, T4likevirus-type, N-terminal